MAGAHERCASFTSREAPVLHTETSTLGFNILVIPECSYSQHILGLIICACIILRNMIIDDECDGSFNENYHTITSVVGSVINYTIIQSSNVPSKG
jgi:hypothetical protein